MIARIAIALVTGLGGLGVYKAVSAKHHATDHPAAGVTPPGAPQPAGTILLPPSPVVNDGDALHTAARALLTTLAATPPSKEFVPAVAVFQQAYNGRGPVVKLKPDGKYGGKCQAALQSVIAPAVAPTSAYGALLAGAPGPVRVARPPVTAAPPMTNVGINQAATVLASAAGLTKSSDPRVSTFQRAYNLTPGVLHLVEDGKYGGSTKTSLQSVLNWLGQGGMAPPSPFPLGAIVNLPVYPPGGADLASVAQATSANLLDTGV